MGLTDVLIVFGVFAGLGYMILSKLREKNPEGYDRTMAWIRGLGNVKEQFKSQKEVQPVVLPESARIM